MSLATEKAKRIPVEQQLQHSSSEYSIIEIMWCGICVYAVVVLTAVKKITTTKYYTDTELHLPLAVSGVSTVTSRAKKRWQLAYTLLHNPDLIELRRRESTGIVEEDKDSKVTGHANPAYVDDGVEMGFPLDKESTKL